MKVKLSNMCKIVKGDDVLVQLRTKNDWPGITFPGGKVEADESMYDACVREVKEETGLCVSQLQLKGIVHYELLDKEERWLIHLYETHTFSGDLCKGVGEDEIFWMKESELLEASLSTDLDKYLQLYENNEVKEAHAYWNGNMSSHFIIK